MLTEAVEFGQIKSAEPVIILGRQNHRDIPFLATNDDRFALGRVEQSGKSLFGVGR